MTSTQIRSILRQANPNASFITDLGDDMWEVVLNDKFELIILTYDCIDGQPELVHQSIAVN